MPQRYLSIDDTHGKKTKNDVSQEVARKKIEKWQRSERETEKQKQPGKI